MAETLSSASLEPQSIYSMEEEQNPISYNLCMFEFFAHLSLSNPKDLTLCKFAIDSLDFLDISEARKLRTF
jgi:hypothetical protein